MTAALLEEAEAASAGDAAAASDWPAAAAGELSGAADSAGADADMTSTRAEGKVEATGCATRFDGGERSNKSNELTAGWRSDDQRLTISVTSAAQQQAETACDQQRCAG